MKKVILLIFALALIFPVVSSLDINVTQNNEPIYLVGSNDSIVFNLTLENKGGSTYINLYNLVGFEMTPREKIKINSGEEKNVVVTLVPLREIDIRGHYSATYYVRQDDDTQQEELLQMQVVELKDAVSISFSEIDPSSNTFTISVQNIDYYFPDLSIHMSSNFFDVEETFDLMPNEKKEFEVNLDRDKFKEMMAGFYTLQADFRYNGIESHLEKPIKFVEKNIIETNEVDKGVIIKTKTITKENTGNVVSTSHTTVKKNIISRLFTSFSPKPTSVEQKGLSVYYTWLSEIEPGEEKEIVVKTNWFFPLLIIFFIVAIVVFAKQYSNTDVILKKRAKFIRAKGGEFGIKISIIVQANKYVENVNLTDRLPQLVKLYERFGNEQPTVVDEKRRKIEWSLNSLEAGEKRVVTYVVYSKLGIVGKFALPKAYAVYQKDGEIKETSSNRTFFIAEQDKVLDVYGN